jgi:hypothetical protein
MLLQRNFIDKNIFMACITVLMQYYTATCLTTHEVWICNWTCWTQLVNSLAISLVHTHARTLIHCSTHLVFSVSCVFTSPLVKVSNGRPSSFSAFSNCPLP